VRYLYIDNFRGFSSTLLPLMQTNFLVGENSTGKSSVLMLLKEMSSLDFMYDMGFPVRKDAPFIEFRDMVSLNSDNQSKFCIGQAEILNDNNGEFSLCYTLHYFSERDGLPFRYHVIAEGYGRFFECNYSRSKRWRARSYPVAPLFSSEEDALNRFREVFSDSAEQEKRYACLQENASDSLRSVVFAAGDEKRIFKNNNDFFSIRKALSRMSPLGTSPIWTAPIRTKPLRIYDGVSYEHSPEGHHAPSLFRKIMKSKSDSISFKEDMVKFGKEGNLFDALDFRSFGRAGSSPMEVLVDLDGINFNISNVGYGVSQVFPLLVDLLDPSNKDERNYVLQQPEVHLHPRAQAALGDMLHGVALSAQMLFVETHSDYLIDRYRIKMRKSKNNPSSQVLYFQRSNTGNTVIPLELSQSGDYPENQPQSYREFFINEDLELLDF